VRGAGFKKKESPKAKSQELGTFSTKKNTRETMRNLKTCQQPLEGRRQKKKTEIAGKRNLWGAKERGTEQTFW